MAVYSTQFYCGLASNGAALYFVPTGQLAVVKYITCQPETNNLDLPFVYEQTTSAPIWYGQPTTDPYDIQYWSGSIVLVAGQVIYFQSYANNPYILTVSGYQLAAM